MNKEIILFGGTFQPFTNAHLRIAQLVSERFPKATLYIVPSNTSFIKNWKDVPKKPFLSDEIRCQLITESVKNLPNCVVSTLECEGILSGRTLETVNYYLNQTKATQIYVCIGADKLKELPHWYGAEELLQKVRFLLFTRGNSVEKQTYEWVQEHKEIFMEIPLPYEEISSTCVRVFYEQEKWENIRECVPEPVYRYLKERKNNDEQIF